MVALNATDMPGMALTSSSEVPLLRVPFPTRPLAPPAGAVRAPGLPHFPASLVHQANLNIYAAAHRPILFTQHSDAEAAGRAQRERTAASAYSAPLPAACSARIAACSAIFLICTGKGEASAAADDQHGTTIARSLSHHAATWAKQLLTCTEQTNSRYTCASQHAITLRSTLRDGAKR